MMQMNKGGQAIDTCRHDKRYLLGAGTMFLDTTRISFLPACLKYDRRLLIPVGAHDAFNT